jgi:serine/threonine protein kinase
VASDLVCPQCEQTCDASHRFCPYCGFPIAELHTEHEEDPLLGTTLPGGYSIQELVGIGGMGRVYRAEQRALGRTVAVKIIHPHLIHDDSASARFITEARATSRLNHPNSVGVIDFGRNGGQLYLVMEFLRGRDLERVVYHEGLLAIPRLVDVMCQVLAALSEAHHLDIIHRDIKPENIVLEPTRSGGDFVKVVDFGLAKMRQATTSITTPGLVCGTPDYMAPEQGRGDAIDARSDLYTCGVILFQMLTGRLPFEADNPTQVVLMHLSKPPQDPAAVAPDRGIPPILSEITLKALAKNPDDRFQSADEFAAVLRDAATWFDRPSPMRGGPVAFVGVKCSACGAQVPNQQKFCGDCGTRVSASHTRPRADDAAPQSQSNRLPLPFTSREEDLAWLEHARLEVGAWLTTARIVGEHGIGKTRLLRHFLESAAAAGDLVVEVGPDPWGASVGFYALRRAIVGLASLPDDGGRNTDWIGASPDAARGLHELFSATNAPGAPYRPAWELPGDDPEVLERRFVVAEALRWAMMRASHTAESRRVVLAIDRLNALDGATLNALLDVIQEPPLVGMLLVATHVPSFDPGWGGPERTLLGLPMATTVSLARGIRAEASEGEGEPHVSPMYIEQFIRFSMEGGRDAPPRLGDLLALRLERLSSDARRALQALAVLGDDADPSNLVELVGIADPDEVLNSLRMAGMIEIRESLVSTAHPLVRDVTFAMMPAGVKRELHERIASHRSDLPTEALAMHAYHAQNAFEALMLLETVSGRCAARGDVAGNIEMLRRGLDTARRELFRGDIDDPERAVVIFSRKLGDALVRSGNVTDANGVLLEALDLVGNHTSERVLVLASLAQCAHVRGRHDEARKFAELAMHHAKDELLVDLVDALGRSGLPGLEPRAEASA